MHKIVVRVEFILLMIIFLGIAWSAYFFFLHGYLPPPFFDDVHDTYMDWYNTAYWAYSQGTYTFWASIYPPISFVFLRIFTNPACYSADAFAGRDCDHIGAVALPAIILTNIVISYLIYRNIEPRTAIPRALALGFGMPMLFAWERGNLVIPCLTVFMLGHGRLLKWAWVRWLCIGASINFKIYLVATLIGSVLKRRWRQAEGYAVGIFVVYIVTYFILGRGGVPLIVVNFVRFAYFPPAASINAIQYAPTYTDILKLLKGPFPIMNFIGSRPMEAMEQIFPLAMKLGEMGVFACFAGVLWRPNSVPSYRLAALAMAYLLTMSTPGGYALVFLTFLVFMEKSTSAFQIIAVISAYLLCIPGDYQIIRVIHTLKTSYLSGRTVGYNTGVSAGSFIRPAVLLILEYALVGASLLDILSVHSDRATSKSFGSVLPKAAGAS
jgi:hypothetical protein